MEKIDVMTEKFSEAEVKGHTALFTEMRVDKATMPDGLYCYELRHGDDDSYPCTVEKNVAVNYFGAVLLKEPLPMEKDYLEIRYDDFVFTGEKKQVYKYLGVEPSVIRKAEDLLLYQRNHVPEISLTPEEAGMLLGYFEGHDYCIGRIGDKLYRGGLSEENMEWEPYALDDVVDICCEWNYELILDIEARMDDPMESAGEQERYEKYKADEARLDRLFEMTSYGREVNVLAEEIANAVIESIGKGASHKEAAAAVTEGIKLYSTGKKGGR